MISSLKRDENVKTYPHKKHYFKPVFLWLTEATGVKQFKMYFNSL